jgi:hypothetical protein
MRDLIAEPEAAVTRERIACGLECLGGSPAGPSSRTPGESAGGWRNRCHSDGSRRSPTDCCVAKLRAAPRTSREGSVFAQHRGTENRSVISGRQSDSAAHIRDENAIPVSGVSNVVAAIEYATRNMRTVAGGQEPGEYPYICTFPGHWKVMNGVLTVVAQIRRSGCKINPRRRPDTEHDQT